MQPSMSLNTFFVLAGFQLSTIHATFEQMREGIDRLWKDYNNEIKTNATHSLFDPALMDAKPRALVMNEKSPASRLDGYGCWCNFGENYRKLKSQKRAKFLLFLDAFCDFELFLDFGQRTTSRFERSTLQTAPWWVHLRYHWRRDYTRSGNQRWKQSMWTLEHWIQSRVHIFKQPENRLRRSEHRKQVRRSCLHHWNLLPTTSDQQPLRRHRHRRHQLRPFWRLRYSNRLPDQSRYQKRNSRVLWRLPFKISL